MRLKRNCLTFLIVTSLIISLCVVGVNIVPKAGASPSWLTGWDYRKSHVINGATGAGTDYQVNITVLYDGSPSGNWEVSGEGHCKTDFGDIRFTDDDETTLLDYWLESKTDSDNAVFWVEVKDDLSSEVTIFMYYGKEDATYPVGEDQTEMDATFIFADHFYGSSIDTGKWEGGTGSASVSGSILTYGPSNAMNSKIDVSDPCALRANRKMTSPSSNWLHFGLGQTDTVNCITNLFLTGASMKHRIGDADSFDTVATDWTSGSYKTLDILWESDEIEFFEEGVERQGSPYTTGANIPSADIPVLFKTSGNYVYADWLLVRKCVDPEPSHGDWGSEEEEEGPQGNSVDLKTPSDVATETAWSVDFVFNATFYQTIQNASLHIENTTSVPSAISWTTHHWNTSSVENKTDETIAYSFSGNGEGSYKWNIEVFNSTHGVYASSNRTLTVDIPPRYQNVDSNSSSILEGGTILLAGQGYDGIGLYRAWLATNETGSWNNYTGIGGFISWYRGATSAGIGFENSTDGITWTAYEGNPMIEGTKWHAYVVQDGDYLYMFLRHNSYHLYLYNVTDYTNPQIMNGGDPVYEHSSTSSDWDYQIFNPSVTIVDDTWHMVLEGKASSGQFKLGYAYSNLTEMDWSAHRSSSLIIDLAGNPYLTYVPERNALLLVHGKLVGVIWEIQASYTTDLTDLNLSSSWTTASTSRFQIQEDGIHVCDPHMMFNFNSTYPIMISYGYNQVNIYQTYCDLSRKEFYDECRYDNNTITLIDEPSNPTRVADDEWEITTVAEQSDFYIEGSQYDSPMDMEDIADTWAWSNFTWSNASIASGNTIQWEIFYEDTYGNVNGTGIHSFTIGEAEAPVSNVELKLPTDASIETQWSVDFVFNATFYQTIQNASLHIENITTVSTSISWTTHHWNTSSVENKTDETITYSFSGNGEGNYKWNIEVFNSTHGIYASSNRTLTINLGDVDRLFYDGFETGDLSLWDKGGDYPYANHTIQSTIKYNGTYASWMNGTASDHHRCEKNVTLTTETCVHLQFYIRIDQAPTGPANGFVFLAGLGDTTPTAEVMLCLNTTSMNFALMTLHHVDHYTESDKTVSLGTWYLIDIYVIVESRVYLLVDGTQEVCRIESETLHAISNVMLIYEIGIGGGWSGNHTVYHDDVLVDDACYEPPSDDEVGPVGPYGPHDHRVVVKVRLNGAWVKGCNVSVEGGPDNKFEWGLTNFWGTVTFKLKTGSYELVATYEQYSKTKPIHVTTHMTIGIDFTTEDIIRPDRFPADLEGFLAWFKLPEIDFTWETFWVFFWLLIVLLIYTVKKVLEGPKRKWKYSYLK